MADEWYCRSAGGSCITSPSPSLGESLIGFPREGLLAYPEKIDVEKLRRMVNQTMPGTDFDGRIRLCPAGATGCMEPSMQPGNLGQTSENVACGAGEYRRAFLSFHSMVAHIGYRFHRHIKDYGNG